MNENQNTSSDTKPLFDELLSVIVPCKNEDEVIDIFYDEFLKSIKEMGNPKFEVIFVEDGSTDNTLDKIRQLSNKDNRVKYITFTRNFGKEASMYAGLKAAKGDLITIMDADLQDPPELLTVMIKAIKEDGYDSVATKRSNRVGEPVIRSISAKCFYKLINFASPIKFNEGARDYRLMTREFLNSVLEISEYNRFTKGIFEWVGYETKWIQYTNIERVAGTTKWTFAQLARYSVDALTSFSAVPLALVSVIGLIFCLLSSIAIIGLSIRQLIFHNSAYGWTSMVCIMFFLSGIQLFCLGIMGQYMSKIYLETKKRPHYIIKERSK